MEQAAALASNGLPVVTNQRLTTAPEATTVRNLTARALNGSPQRDIKSVVLHSTTNFPHSLEELNHLTLRLLTQPQTARSSDAVLVMLGCNAMAVFSFGRRKHSQMDVPAKWNLAQASAPSIGERLE